MLKSGVWNYRLCKRSEPLPDGTREVVHEIHEVYYDADGNITGWTEGPAWPSGETWVEFQNNMSAYNQAALSSKSKVIDLDEMALSAKTKPC